MTSYKIIVSGKVQGVYYRKTIKENAIKFSYKGYIKNLKNKDVEVGVMLDDSTYDRFINILKKGSKFSQVNSLKIEKTNEVFSNFSIKY